MLFIILGVVVVLVIFLIVHKAIHTASLFMDESFRWGGGQTMMKHDIRKNQSGYSDPTAFEAITKVDKEMEKLNKTLHIIRNVCELAGFEIEERIVLKDKKTGKIWR